MPSIVDDYDAIALRLREMKHDDAEYCFTETILAFITANTAKVPREIGLRISDTEPKRLNIQQWGYQHWNPVSIV